MRATSKHLQIQGRSAKHIFILQMHRNIVSLFKRFGRQVFQNRTSSSCKPLCVTVEKITAKTGIKLKLNELYTKKTIIWSIIYLTILVTVLTLLFIGRVDLNEVLIIIIISVISLFKYLYLKKCPTCNSYYTKIYKNSFFLPDAARCFKCGTEYEILNIGENTP